MTTQPDTAERRAVSRRFLQVIAGVMPFECMEQEFKDAGLKVLHNKTAEGGDRFRLFERQNGKLWDTFVFSAWENF